MSLKDLKPNKVQVLLEKYIHVFIGARKSGKTTLFRDIVLEHYNGDLSKGLLFGFEKGYQALDGIYSQDINEWSDYSGFVDELIDDRDNLPYRLICIDTIDEMVNMAEEEAIRFYNRRTDVKAYTINEAGGGYGRGRDYAKTLIRDSVNRLIKGGFGIVLIGHSKEKKLKTKDGNEYNILSHSLNNDYGDVFMDMADLITFFTIEKEVKDKIAKKSIFMNFRSDGYIDCGGRFKVLPEKIGYGATNYLQVFADAVKSSIINTNDNVDKLGKDQKEKLEKDAKEFADEKKKEPLIETIKEKYAVVLEGAKNGKTEDEKMKSEVQKIMKKYKITTFKNPKDLSYEGLKEIAKLLNPNEEEG